MKAKKILGVFLIVFVVAIIGIITSINRSYAEGETATLPVTLYDYGAEVYKNGSSGATIWAPANMTILNYNTSPVGYYYLDVDGDTESRRRYWYKLYAGVGPFLEFGGRAIVSNADDNSVTLFRTNYDGIYYARISHAGGSGATAQTMQLGYNGYKDTWTSWDDVFKNSTYSRRVFSPTSTSVLTEQNVSQAALNSFLTETSTRAWTSSNNPDPFTSDHTAVGGGHYYTGVYKKVYTNTKFTFNKEDNWYIFDSRADEAIYNPGNKTVQIRGDRNVGFWPFRYTTDGALTASGKQSAAHFGMTMDLKFYLGQDGKIRKSDGTLESQQFTFGGDDDFVLYIDGKKAIDLSGDHGLLVATVDFAAKRVYYHKSRDPELSDYWDETGKAHWVSPGETPPTFKEWALSHISINGYSLTAGAPSGSPTGTFGYHTFAQLGIDSITNTAGNHNLKFVYLERYAAESNLILKFNLPEAVDIDYKISGTDYCSIALPNSAAVFIGTNYTAASPLIPSGQERVCGTRKCTFKGWYTNTALTTPWTTGLVTGDMTLYGGYTCREKASIQYHVEKYTSPKDGRQYPTAASAGAPTETGDYWIGDPYTQKPKLTDGVYDGKRCRFTGWNTRSDYTGTWTNGSSLTGNLNLYGKWDCDEPIDITYHVEQYTNTTHPELPNKLPPDSVTPTETTQYYQRDTYTVKPGLTTTYDGMICTFDGWWENAAMTGNKTTTKTLSGNVDFYGKWNCKERYTKPEKETDKEILDLDDEFTYTIKNSVPALTSSEFATYKYRSYKITDTIEDIIEIGNITVYLNGRNVSRNFNITRDDQTVVVEAKSEYINNIDFYGKTYEIRIVGSIKDYYRENEEDLLEQYKNKTIDNKATLTIDNKYNIDSNKVEQEIKRVKINYQIIGTAPPADVTDPTPGEEEITKGTKYTQKPKLTTRYREKLCTFNGWYSNEDFTRTWQDGNNLYEDLTLYGSWECSDLVNDIHKSTDDVKTTIGEEYEYKITNSVPALNESQYYQSYVIEDQLESVVTIDGEEKIEIMSGEEDVKDKFNVTIENNKITIAAKDTTSADFYGKEYEIRFKVYIDKAADLSEYKQGNKYVIPNKASLSIKLHDGEDVDKETPEVDKEIGPVIISYEVIGDGPDIEKTDKVPDDDEIPPGEKYTAKDGLTTRDDSKICTFDGWYEEREFKNKYQNDTVLYEDITLYGKWNCKPIDEVIETPDTGKNLPIAIIGILFIAGSIFTYFKIKKVSN